MKGKDKEIIKSGTLLCWVFGHRFVKKISRENYDFDNKYYPNMKFTKLQEYPFCVRCGLKR